MILFKIFCIYLYLCFQKIHLNFLFSNLYNLKVKNEQLLHFLLHLACKLNKLKLINFLKVK